MHSTKEKLSLSVLKEQAVCMSVHSTHNISYSLLKEWIFCKSDHSTKEKHMCQVKYRELRPVIKTWTTTYSPGESQWVEAYDDPDMKMWTTNSSPAALSHRWITELRLMVTLTWKCEQPIPHLLHATGIIQLQVGHDAARLEHWARSLGKVDAAKGGCKSDL